MQTLTPAPVIELLAAFLSHEVWRVREEIVNIIIMALSTFNRDQFDFGRLTSCVSCFSFASPSPFSR